MGILDEAIREHLELKRRHGAGDTELRKIEDEAFGPPARPGDAEVAVEAPVPELPEIADDPTLVAAEQPVIQPAGPAEPTEPLPEAVETAEERIEPISEPPGEASIADQPTELYDHDEGEPPAEGAAEDEFFSEQSLSDELDQALDAPEDEQAPPPPDTGETLSPDPDEQAPPPPDTGEALSPDPDEQAPPPPDTGETLPPDPDEQPGPEEGESGLENVEEEGEDVLEETPDFLQETPEHDRLWFEQRPPKDFDFDD